MTHRVHSRTGRSEIDRRAARLFVLVAVYSLHAITYPASFLRCMRHADRLFDRLCRIQQTPMQTLIAVEESVAYRPWYDQTP